MNKIFYILTLILLLTACSKEESNSRKPLKVNAISVLKDYPVDTNYFKVMKNNGRDELVIFDEFGKREISFVYDQYGLFRTNYYVDGNIVQSKILSNSGDTTSVIYSIFDPKTKNEFSPRGIEFLRRNIKIIESDQEIIQTKETRYRRCEKKSLLIKIPKVKKYNKCWLITDGVDEFFRIDKEKFNFIDVSNQSKIEIPLNTVNPGINYLRGIIYYSLIDSLGKIKGNTNRIFEYKYHVDEKDKLSQVEKEFYEFVNRKTQQAHNKVQTQSGIK